MFSGQSEKLGPDPEFFEGHFRVHREPSPRHVPLPQPRRVGQDLDEAAVPGSDPGLGFGFGFGFIERFGHEEGVVDVAEGVERDAVLRQDGEVRVGGIVDDRRREEAARGGDERGRRAVGALGSDEAFAEDAGSGAREVHGGVGVDVDVVEVGGLVLEEAIP